jgi:hypothetical protein
MRRRMVGGLTGPAGGFPEPSGDAGASNSMAAERRVRLLRRAGCPRAVCGISRQGTTSRSSLRLSTRRRLLPDNLAHARLHAVFNGESAIGTICARRGRRVERHAQRFLIPQDLSRPRTRASARFPGRSRPRMSTPRGHLRPDKGGRERPPSEWVPGRLPGVAEGVAHAPNSLSAIIRAASAAAKNAAAFSTTGRAHPLVCQGLRFQCRLRSGTVSFADPACS